MASRKIIRNQKTGRYVPLTVGAVEKETGRKINITDKSLKVSKYFEQKGYASLSKAMEKIEHNLTK